MGRHFTFWYTDSRGNNIFSRFFTRKRDTERYIEAFPKKHRKENMALKKYRVGGGNQPPPLRHPRVNSITDGMYHSFSKQYYVLSWFLILYNSPSHLFKGPSLSYANKKMNE